MNRQTIRIRRVGSVTFGLVLVACGILFLVHLFLPTLNYTVIFRLWPLMLITLGIEVLASSRDKNVRVVEEDGRVVEESCVKYDMPAIFLMGALTFFIMIMAGMDWIYVNGLNYINIG